MAMSMATASGTMAIASTIVGRLPWKPNTIADSRPRTTTPNVIHLSCCRSSPCERTNRRTIEAIPARISAGKRNPTTSAILVIVGTPGSVSTDPSRRAPRSGQVAMNPTKSTEASRHAQVDEPPPSPGDRPAVGEELHDQRAHGYERYPGPRRDPAGEPPARPGPGSGHQGVLRVGVRGRLEGREQRPADHQPPDRVPRMKRGDERPGNGEDHGEHDHE